MAMTDDSRVDICIGDGVSNVGVSNFPISLSPTLQFMPTSCSMFFDNSIKNGNDDAGDITDER